MQTSGSLGKRAHPAQMQNVEEPFMALFNYLARLLPTAVRQQKV